MKFQNEISNLQEGQFLEHMVIGQFGPRLTRCREHQRLSEVVSTVCTAGTFIALMVSCTAAPPLSLSPFMMHRPYCTASCIYDRNRCVVRVVDNDSLYNRWCLRHELLNLWLLDPVLLQLLPYTPHVILTKEIKTFHSSCSSNKKNMA